MLLFEITRTKARHKRLRDILLPAPAQCLNVISDGRIIVGYPSGFTIYSLMGDQHPLALIQPEHPSISFISHHPLDALCAVEMNNQEYLLVFSTLAVYVDYQGRKSREREIMYPAPPEAIGKTQIRISTCSPIKNCARKISEKDDFVFWPPPTYNLFTD